MVDRRIKKLKDLETIANLTAERDMARLVSAREKVEAQKAELSDLQSSQGFDAGVQSSEASELWEEFRALALSRGFRALARDTQTYESAYSTAKVSRGRALAIRNLRRKL